MIQSGLTARPTERSGEGSGSAGTPSDALDAIVVGAGPAGCAAAYDLAVQGLRVLILDRTEFPRRKACAGGLTVKAFRALRYPIDPVVQRTVNGLTVSCRMGRRKRLTAVEPVCHLVARPAFDRFCLDRTLDAGARFGVVKRIDGVEETRRAVTLATDRGNLRARYLVGADGVHSRIRCLTGRFPGLREAFAVEGVVDRRSPDCGTLDFDFSYVPGGYGWVFPKRDHLNVGLYTTRTRHSLTRRALSRYAAAVGLPPPTRIAGWPLGIGGWRYRPGRGRVMLVGDAAGLVDPLLGEGLYHAVTSGQHAAAAIAAGLTTGGEACRRYAAALRPIQHDLLFSELAATFFYRMPVLGHLLLISPAASIPLMKGFAMGLPFLTTFRYGYRFWLDRPLPMKDSAGPFP